MEMNRLSLNSEGAFRTMMQSRIPHIRNITSTVGQTWRVNDIIIFISACCCPLLNIGLPNIGLPYSPRLAGGLTSAVCGKSSGNAAAHSLDLKSLSRLLRHPRVEMGWCYSLRPAPHGNQIILYFYSKILTRPGWPWVYFLRNLAWTIANATTCFYSHHVFKFYRD